MYLGSWKVGDYLTFPCNTHKVSGEAFDADSDPSYRIYEDETGTPVATGTLEKLDDAGTLGFYTERRQLLSATGFEKGKCYTIYITATVDSKIGTMSHTFQIEAEVNVARIFSYVVEGALTFVEYLRLLLSGLALKTSGGGTSTLRSRDLADSKDRIMLTVDENKNRTGVTLDGS